MPGRIGQALLDGQLVEQLNRLGFVLVDLDPGIGQKLLGRFAGALGLAEDLLGDQQNERRQVVE